MDLKVRAYYGSGFGSSFIRWFGFDDCTHVSLVFNVGYAYEEIESIQGRGVICHRPHSHKNKRFQDYDVPVSEEQILEAHILARSFVGAKYDWRGIYGFLVRKKRHNPDKWFCSEFVAYILYKIKYALSRREPYREQPSMIAQSLRIVAPMSEIGGA